MSKIKKTYICNQCGGTHPKWSGQCSHCGHWNTIEEISVSDDKRKPNLQVHSSAHESLALKIQDIESSSDFRWVTPDQEMNRILGGGIVPGSMVLIGGEPGIGKSTLMLQLAMQLAPNPILYVSGEESARQIKMRADRLSYKHPELYLLSENSLESIEAAIIQIKPTLIVIDSIQTIYIPALESAPGSVTQVRECTSRLMRIAKTLQIPLFIIGHVTKEGTLAGPKMLEHMVDTVLSFEGDRHYAFRIVRTTKNRFGSTSELGIYEMSGDGLREVSNPSEIFLTTQESVSGVAIGATLEGNRPILLETQALVTDTAYGNAQRSATGYDLRRLAMMLAVLEKKSGFKLGMKDVFINLAGGIKIEDPALDLALACAIVSSYYDLPIPIRTAFAAEIGLTGEIRPVQRLEQRILEAEKLGFEKIIVSSGLKAEHKPRKTNIEIITTDRLESVFRNLFS